MDRVRRYLEEATTTCGAGSGYDAQEDERSASRTEARDSDTKSIGSLSQRLFESDKSDDEKCYHGTCNGYDSQRGSKSNLLLCSECDLMSRGCCGGSYGKIHVVAAAAAASPSRSSGGGGGGDARAKDQRASRSYDRCDVPEEARKHHGDRYSPSAPPSCARCISDSDERDLICFRCQNLEVCPSSECCAGTKSTDEEGKYPVDAVVKIHVNNRSIDVDSDETVDSDASPNREADEDEPVDRLATIDEVKGDTASENGEDGAAKLNGTPRTRYLNYMMVLFL